MQPSARSIVARAATFLAGHARVMARRRVLLALGAGIALAVVVTAAFLGSRAPAAKPEASAPKLPRRQPEHRTMDAIATSLCNLDVDRVVRQEWRTQRGWLRTTFDLCLSPRAAQERMRAVFLMVEDPIVSLASPREAFKIGGTTVLRRGALYWEVEGTAPVVDALVEFMDRAAPE